MSQDLPDLESFIHAKTAVFYPHVRTRGRDTHDPSSHLEEAIGLAHAIELKIEHAEVISVRQVNSSTYFGSGTISRIQDVIQGHELELVVVDTDLSPIQQRNLERKWKVKVIDRTGLILEIFGARARTAEGRLQVELAALTYQRSRLVRSWTHLERQRGSLGFVGGPGETQIEVDRRLIDDRINKLKKELGKVKRTRELHRKSRRQVPYPIVALVGYTNAGKSTLFNHLTESEVFAKDLLFATLDPTMRSLKLPSGREIILSDTVGFISKLPTQLVAAFRATLEEVCEADLLLHVQDISHPEHDDQKREVIKILKELDLDQKIQDDTLDILNKIDLLEDAPLAKSRKKFATSALTGDGVEDLLKAIEKHLAKLERIYDIELNLVDGAALSWLYEHGEVLKRTDEDLSTTLKVKLSEKDHKRFQAKF